MVRKYQKWLGHFGIDPRPIITIAFKSPKITMTSSPSLTTGTGMDKYSVIVFLTMKEIEDGW